MTTQDTPVDADADAPTETSKKSKRSVSLPLATLAWSAVTAVLTITVLALAILLVAARGDISDRNVAADNAHHAEQVASDYATGAATVNFADFNTWVSALKANTTPALASKFDTTAPKMQEILTPLQWTSTATPVTAVVASSTGGIYQVNVFVNVTSTNAQAPEGTQTTVTYNITVDSNADWKISDVGGMDGALPVK
jgi:Mce-associated membrane protein